MNKIVREKTEGVEKKLYVGFDKVSVVGVNPTKDQLMKLLNIEDENTIAKFKEPEYQKTDKDGIDVAGITFYVKTSYGEILPVYFNVKKEVKSSDSGKVQYINQVGQTAWVKDENELSPSFTNFIKDIKEYSDGENTAPKWFKGAIPSKFTTISKKQYRKAYVGEEELMNFLIKLSNLDVYSPDASVFYDVSKFFKDNYKEIQQFISDCSEDFLMAPICVKTKNDGKEINVIPNKFFLNGNFYFSFERKPVTIDSVRHMKASNQRLSPVEDLIYKIIDTEYGIKDFFIPVICKEYNSEMNMLNTVEEGPVQVKTDTDLPF
jgi:hypothetical protein